jgi:hypothetical protein
MTSRKATHWRPSKSRKWREPCKVFVRLYSSFQLINRASAIFVEMQSRQAATKVSLTGSMAAAGNCRTSAPAEAAGLVRFRFACGRR